MHLRESYFHGEMMTTTDQDKLRQQILDSLADLGRRYPALQDDDIAADIINVVCRYVIALDPAERKTAAQPMLHFPHNWACFSRFVYAVVFSLSGELGGIINAQTAQSLTQNICFNLGWSGMPAFLDQYFAEKHGASGAKDGRQIEFISALQRCRTTPHRVMCKYNDRGYKVSYYQDFEYDLSKVTDVVSAFRGYDSAYKNYCLYVAINKLNQAEPLLLQTLDGICGQRYDVFGSEGECWGGVMCALKLADLHYLTNTLSEASLPLIRLCLLLLNIYLKYHSAKDPLRAIECYASRARLNERLYRSHLFVHAVSEYADVMTTNPVIAKYLCMYDWGQAKRLASHELVNMEGKSYDYFASQLMMYQNQGLGVVLPEQGDPFDAPFDATIQWGRRLADAIDDRLESRIPSVFESFRSGYETLSARLSALVASYYQQQNAGKDNQLTRFCCLCCSHQLEPYPRFGIVKAEFTPVRYRLKDFLRNVQIRADQLDGPNENEEGRRYRIREFDKKPEMHHEGEPPVIRQLLIFTDHEDNLKAFRCLGFDFKDWASELRRYHAFFGVAVRITDKDFSGLPETLNLMVCFQTENDINL